MAREIDDKKKRRALNRLRKAKQAAEKAAGEGEADRELSDWESEFVDSVEERLETFGSAFADPDKGALDEPLSALQAAKLKEIEKKASGKARPRKPMSRGSGFKQGSGFKKKTPAFKSRSRDIHEDLEDEAPPQSERAPNERAPNERAPNERAEEPPPRPSGPPKLRVIKGGG